MEVRRGERPLILLDDVFSELDTMHQDRLMQSLKGHQVLLTTTHVPDRLADAVLWTVGDGEAVKSTVTV